MMFAEEIRSISNEVLQKEREKNREEAIKWANETIEPLIKEAAERGEYSITLGAHNLPVNYHALRKFLMDKHYYVDYKGSERQIIYIRW